MQRSLSCNKQSAFFLSSLRQRKEGPPFRAYTAWMAEESSEPIMAMTVDAIMRRWPATIRVFLDFKMRCVGCPIAGFHSLKEACRDHHLTSEQVLAALKAAVEGPAASGLGGILCECKQAVRISQSDALPVAHD